MASVARKEIQQGEPYLARAEVSRFTFNDFTTRGTWLIDRLRKVWPDMTERNAFGWLKTCIDSKEYHFTKTDRAVLMAVLVSVQLSNAPRVEEIFMFLDDPNDLAAQAQGATLYRDLRGWAATCNASEIIVENESDVTRPFIELALGKIWQRDIAFAMLGNGHAT